MLMYNVQRCCPAPTVQLGLGEVYATTTSTNHPPAAAIPPSSQHPPRPVPSVQLDLGEVYAGLPAGRELYRLRSMVCYYGAHYQAFVLVPELKRWLLFDDARVANIGTWADVRRKVSKAVASHSAALLEHPKCSAWVRGPAWCRPASCFASQHTLGCFVSRLRT